MNQRNIVVLVFLICLTPLVAFAQADTGVKVPSEVRPFIENGMIANALEAGDLNADGKKDYILVISKPRPDNATFDNGEDDQRETLILIRDAAGKLLIAGRNDKVAFCRTCGGVFGDPLAGVEIKGTSFTVSNYGGSNWRWSSDFTFTYSRRDNTWQATRVEESSFYVFEPKKVKTSVYTPPRSFGLINFADFDPDNFKGKGKK